MSQIIAEEVMQRFKERNGYVYLIHAEGTNRYKIGRSNNPVSRLETLKGQSPYPLKIILSVWTPDSVTSELYLHEKYREYRIYGEWFDFPEKTDKEFFVGFWGNIHDCFTFHLNSRLLGEYSEHLEKMMLEHLQIDQLTEEDSLYFRSQVYCFISQAKSVTELIQCFDFLETVLPECVSFDSSDFCFSMFYAATKTASAFIFHKSIKNVI